MPVLSEYWLNFYLGASSLAYFLTNPFNVSNIFIVYNYPISWKNGSSFYEYTNSYDLACVSPKVHIEVSSKLHIEVSPKLHIESLHSV